MLWTAASHRPSWRNRVRVGAPRASPGGTRSPSTLRRQAGVIAVSVQSVPYNRAQLGPHPRHPPRRLRSHRADRRRRHGRGVSRPRHEAQSRRRAEGPAGLVRRAIPIGSRGSRAKRRRSRRSIIPTSRTSTASKNRTASRALVMELVEGEDLSQRIARGADSARRGAADREADRRGARSRARAGHHPSRSEAREHQGARRRHGEGARLRPRESDGAGGRVERQRDELADAHAPAPRSWA